MLVRTFKGHRLSNGAAAIAFYYPAVSNGGDMINDFVSTVDNPAKVYWIGICEFQWTRQSYMLLRIIQQL